MWILIVIAALLGALGGCAPAVERAGTVPTATSTAPAAVADYQLGVADRLRVTVFNEPNLSGEFSVNAVGKLSFPLVGDIVAAGRTTTQLGDELQTRLAGGYLREPRVAVEVIVFRPFYILGEVNRPGEYPYSVGLTVFKAVATAQGFTYRANRRRVFVTTVGNPQEIAEPLTSSTQVRPGDTIRIGERYF